MSCDASIYRTEHNICLYELNAGIYCCLQGRFERLTSNIERPTLNIE